VTTSARCRSACCISDTVYGKQTNLLMAASVMNVIPLIILFVCLQKYLVKGIQMGAVKG